MQLSLGDAPGPSKVVEFPIRSAFAEYVSLPDVRHELRITLTNYESSCDSYQLPEQGQYAVIVTIATPPAQAPKAGLFDWLGHEAHGGTPDRPERAYAVPLVRTAGRAYEFRPGGGVELKELNTGDAAAIRGLLSFEFAGDADHPAQSIKGSFVARVCRSLPSPADGSVH